AAMLVAAVASGAFASAGEGAPQPVRAAYRQLVGLIADKYAGHQPLLAALLALTHRPESQPQQAAFATELGRTQLAEDAEVIAAARQLLAQLDPQDQTREPASAVPSGYPGRRRADPARSHSERNVIASGSISGNMIVTGDGNRGDPHQPLAGPAQPAQPSGSQPVVLLFLAANPDGAIPLRLDEEVRAIDAAMRQGALRDRFDLRTHWAVRVADLQELLLRYRPAIVHFSGHGSAAGEIILVDDAQGSVALPAARLGELLRSVGADLRCVVLNACFSQQQAAALAEVIDTVVGMPNALDDQTARLFAVAFYRALAYGRTVETAFDQVRVRGEISGYRGPHSSGHAYFSLKDDRARIDAVV
ncbi:MAG TPA: exodeoxyribonuclease VII large subunit, partial [Caldilineaceae bacterium]|nr:exodeoxyribonuclease VII large subunit [Caldilineaceae bacterium]